MLLSSLSLGEFQGFQEIFQEPRIKAKDTFLMLPQYHPSDSIPRHGVIPAFRLSLELLSPLVRNLPLINDVLLCLVLTYTT